jgi:hypothetical protein
MKLLTKLRRRRKPVELLPGTWISHWHRCTCPMQVHGRKLEVVRIAHDCVLHGISAEVAV